MKALSVTALEGYKVNVVFADGVSGEVDLSALVENGIFRKLKDPEAFNKVYTHGSSIAWSDELEIDADNIYAEILKADPEKLLHSSVYHAAD